MVVRRSVDLDGGGGRVGLGVVGLEVDFQRAGGCVKQQHWDRGLARGGIDGRARRSLWARHAGRGAMTAMERREIYPAGL